jgi:thiol-disulfide isomerase/thioredoxin
MGAVLALVLSAVLAGCGEVTYRDTTPGPAPAEVRTGWQEVTPMRVTLPTSEPVAATDDTLAANAGAQDSMSEGVVLVNVWASYCAPCRAEMPLLEKLNDAGDVRVVGLSRDTVAAPAEQMLVETGVSFANWLDPGAAFGVALDGRIPLNAVPSSALLVDGQVQAVHVGEFRSRADVLEGLAYAT